MNKLSTLSHIILSKIKRFVEIFANFEMFSFQWNSFVVLCSISEFGEWRLE